MAKIDDIEQGAVGYAPQVAHRQSADAGNERIQMTSKSTGQYVAAIAILISLAGCYSPSPSRHNATPTAKPVSMKYAGGHMDGMVGSIQYHAFESGPIEFNIASGFITATTDISEKGFGIIAEKMEELTSTVTLIHESSLGKKLDQPKDREAFVAKLNQLIALHKNETGDVVVFMEGNNIAGSLEPILQRNSITVRRR